MSTAELLQAILQASLWSGLATIGFAVLFNVPRRLLPYCVTAGIVGYVTRILLIVLLDADIIWATLIGAMAIGFLSYGFARWLHVPSLIFAISAAIPLVPGKLAFETLANILQIVMFSDGQAVSIDPVMIEVIRIGLILTAIAVGISVPAMLFQRVKPVV